MIYGAFCCQANSKRCRWNERRQALPHMKSIFEFAEMNRFAGIVVRFVCASHEMTEKVQRWISLVPEARVGHVRAWYLRL
jgi:hypothetical protein